jgi:FkbM family methyltransferase
MTNPLTDPLFALLKADRLTAVVDIGANPIAAANPVPYQRMLAAGLCTVIGFEPQPVALAELNRTKGPHEQYLPYVVGDGRDQTLHVCKAIGMTGLLEPNPARLALFNEFPMIGQVEEKISVSTRRLDDIGEIQFVDFLKMDVQGAELQVLSFGKQKLASTVILQTEVSFVPLYYDQPPFGSIDLMLRDMGFIPHGFAEALHWPIAPMVIDGNPRKPLRQMIEADLIYVRDFTHAKNMTGEQWKQLALVAHHCYRSTDLALRAIISATQIGALPEHAPESYLKLLRRQKTA